MQPRYDLLVFDLDGTLIDSTLDLALSVNATRAQEGLAPLSTAQISSYVGNGAHTLIRRSLGSAATAESVRRGLRFFLMYYREHMLDNTRLYPGVREALEAWQAAGTRMAVLTNKPERFSADLIAGLGLGNLFARIYGGNSFATKKPDPYGLRVIMRELGCGPENHPDDRRQLSGRPHGAQRWNCLRRRYLRHSPRGLRNRPARRTGRGYEGAGAPSQGPGWFEWNPGRGRREFPVGGPASQLTPRRGATYVPVESLKRLRAGAGRRFNRFRLEFRAGSLKRMGLLGIRTDFEQHALEPVVRVPSAVGPEGDTFGMQACAGIPAR